MSTLKIEHISHLDNGTPDLSIDSSGHLNIVNGNLQMGGVTMLDASTGSLNISGTLKGNLLELDTIALPAAGTARIFNRNTDNDLYIQTGSGSTINLLDANQDSMYNVSTNLHTFLISNSPKVTIDSNGLAVSGNSVATQKKALAHSLVFGG